MGEVEDSLDVASSAAVMVRVHGPDPKGRKMRRHAFYHSESGDTTLSASGLVLPRFFNSFKNVTNSNKQDGLIVVTCASIIEPFLSSKEHGSSAQGTPTLIFGAKIDVMTEVVRKSDDANAKFPSQDHSWLPAHLLALVDVPGAAVALKSLLEAHGGTSDQSSWEVGWALAPADNGPQLHGNISQGQVERRHRLKEGKETEDLINGQSVTFNGSSQSSSAFVAIATTRIAVLNLPYSANMKIMSEITISEPRKRGDFLLVIGSPFGALSPLHFYNSISVGIVANSWPPASSQPTLLMADIRCLPGMEGSPVFSDRASLVGILTRPLRQRGGGAEVQLVITWDALVPALGELQLMLPEKFRKPDNTVHLGSPLVETASNQFPVGSCSSEPEEIQCCASTLPSASSSTIDHAMASVVLVTVGDGAWASGIVLNKKGLILTNAHLLEPWRFGKTPPYNKYDDGRRQRFTRFSNRFRSQLVTGACNDQQENQVNSSSPMATSTNECTENVFPSDRLITRPTLDLSYKSYRRIRVRLDHLQPRSWSDARVVYVSKGPLDIALLQLELIPNQLCPIVPEIKSPCPGSKALVIGHGLFGPRSDLCPSVSAGVVARVVNTRKSHMSDEVGSVYPAMLETTAAVHPGGSGGVVVNAQGRMIGLVTSNARHSGGTVIPHLNFSIPCAVLKPIFKFATGNKEELSILHDINKPNELLSEVWALVPPTPPRPSPSMPFLPDALKNDKSMSEGVQKGSRFAKFVAEKGAELAFKQDMYQKHDVQRNLKGLPIKTSRAGDFLHSRL